MPSKRTQEKRLQNTQRTCKYVADTTYKIAYLKTSAYLGYKVRQQLPSKQIQYCRYNNYRRYTYKEVTDFVIDIFRIIVMVFLPQQRTYYFKTENESGTVPDSFTNLII